MRKPILILLLVIFTSYVPQAQQPQKPSASEILESIQKLNFLGSVLYVAAHPDDENTRLISYMSNKVKARTAYLSLTRGDGGQNLIGPEIRELLGVIRTQELLAARRVDGGEQMFTRANDFGYSKHPDETLKIWEKDNVLSDVVWAIRKFKPDVIINRFNHRTPGTTHGHHTSSAMLSVEAFDLVNDKNAFPDQLKNVDVWQPKRLFFNTGRFFYRNQEDFDKASKDLINFDVGVYYPLKGLSNNEVASLASSQHLCQGFGRLTRRGSQQEYIEFLKGEFPEDKSNVFSGVDTTWNRIGEGGQFIGSILYDIEKNFNFKDPSTHLPELLIAYNLLQKTSDAHWKTIKSKELKAIIEACAGLYLEASVSLPTVSTGSDINLNIEALNRSNIEIELLSYNISTTNTPILKNTTLKENTRQNFREQITIPNTLHTTSPYWLDNKGSLGMYHVNDDTLIGLPETPRTVTVDFYLTINKIPITFTKDLVYRYSQPDKGELYRPFEIIPEVAVSINDKVFIFENDKQKEIPVTITAGRDNLRGSVSLDIPTGWKVTPPQDINIVNKGETRTLVFTITPPQFQSEGIITPKVNIDGKIYSKELIEINYSHIPIQTVLLPSESKVVRLDIQKVGNNIAYIEGAGDVVPESLEQIGYNVIKIKPEEITPEYLSQFDAVVVGIRAYNTIAELKFRQRHLLDFVAQGGNMIVQYNTSFRLTVDTKELAPFDLKLSRDRVTDEHAEVRFLNTNHSILNYPNKITKNDFEGWVQERGLYFPNEWASEFTPIISINDNGETPKNGSLLVAKYGKGHYIYTGLSFFREFPAGVSGAYRLFANMLSIGKDNIKIDKKLND
ncbi:PIG-L family deacetylase [Flavobacteriaceae bacterium AU392]|nr:PIG-L family deacetylase [Flavobacteriaceae bacterium]RKM86483.1 PIG-L family deacetylase [Flavobacteriaceae bacterium AU392]